DQAGADDLAVIGDETAIGLGREQALAYAGQCERIEDAEQERESDGERDGGAERGFEIGEHSIFLLVPRRRTGSSYGAVRNEGSERLLQPFRLGPGLRPGG